MSQPTAQQPYAPGSPFEVQDTPEFRRVLNLPRRDWEEAAKQNDLYRRMTAAFKMPGGTQELRLIQASALADAHDERGLLAPIRVGEGKTLLTFLLPTVIQGIQRPTLLLPAALVEKTWREFQILRQHWIPHAAWMTRRNFDQAVITYELLGRDSGKDRLNDRRPDILIGDEIHFLKNRQAARTRKVERFMIANPETIFCGLSGTITTRSLLDYWHLAYWALKHKMPLPRIEAEAEKWAEVLDEKKTEAIGRRGAGVLMQFCSPEERVSIAVPRTAPVGRTQQMGIPVLEFQQKLTVARKGYQRRLRETPGVICSPNVNLACSLVIRRLPVNPGHRVITMIEDMRESWQTPNGDEIEMPTQIWSYARQLSCGFWYKWIPPPPAYWMSARRSWHWNVRQILDPEGLYYEKYAHLHLDSPMQVGLAVAGAKGYETTKHVLDDFGNPVYDPQTGEPLAQIVQIPARAPTITDPGIAAAYREWKRVEKDFKPNSVAEWVSDDTLKYCQAWMKQNGPGIVWTEHRAFGIRLAEMLGTGFCSNKGLDAAGKSIEDYNGAPVVASVAANKTGRNLQAWNRNLVVTASPTGALWEQLLGRTHRMGQQADTVFVDWIAACEEQDMGFSQLLADARYIQDTTGQSQKLLYADRI